MSDIRGRKSWGRKRRDNPYRLSNQDVAGCLETVIESAETHVRKRDERGYLNYLQKFMKRAGVSIQVVPADELEDTELEDD